LVKGDDIVIVYRYQKHRDRYFTPVSDEPEPEQPEPLEDNDNEEKPESTED
jgi:hypothetical protein